MYFNTRPISFNGCPFSGSTKYFSFPFDVANNPQNEINANTPQININGTYPFLNPILLKNPVIFAVNILPIVNTVAHTPAPKEMIIFLCSLLRTAAGRIAICGIVYIVTVIP